MSESRKSVGKGIVLPPGASRGIDVQRSARDITNVATSFFKLPATQAYLRARSASGHRSARIELEDFLQEVLFTIWRRNGQPSVFDPKKASASKYVWQVCRTVLSHSTDPKDAEDTADATAWGRIERTIDGAEDEAPDEQREALAERPDVRSLAKAVEADTRVGQLRLFDAATELGIKAA